MVRQLERNIEQYTGEESETSWEDVEGVDPLIFLCLSVVV
jgi:hypothetical protein